MVDPQPNTSLELLEKISMWYSTELLEKFLGYMHFAMYWLIYNKLKSNLNWPKTKGVTVICKRGHTTYLENVQIGDLAEKEQIKQKLE